MKKYLILFIAAISSSFFVGCDYEEFESPNYVSFEANQKDFTVTENSSGSFDVTVYTANVTGNDRTFEINVEEASTLDVAAYDLPETVTVPGNSNEATFTVNVSDTNVDNAGETLVLSLGSVEGMYTGTPITVNVYRFCAIDINDYVGTFTGPGSWSSAFGYTTEVETFYSDNGDLMINGLLFQWFQDWWGEVIITNQPVRIVIDEETGAVNIPEQPYITSTYDGEAQPAYSIKGTGRINACEKTLIINPVLVQSGADIDGTAWGPKFVETITLAEDSGTGEEPGDGDETDGDETDGDETDGDETDGDETDGDGDDSDDDGDDSDDDGDESDEDGDDSDS